MTTQEKIQKLQQELDTCEDFMRKVEIKDEILALKGTTPQRTCNIDDEECENCGS